MISLLPVNSQFASNAYLASSGASSANARATSPSQLAADTYTASSQSEEIDSYFSTTSSYSVGSVTLPLSATSVHLKETLEKTGAGSAATLELTGETTGIDYILTHEDDGTILISPFGAFSYRFDDSIAVSESSSSSQAAASLTSSATEIYCGVVQRSDVAMLQSALVSNGALADEPRTSGGKSEG